MITGSQQSSYDAGVAENEFVFSLRPILNVVRKRLWIIVLVMVLFSGVAVVHELQQPPLYEASIKILVGREGQLINNPNDVIGLQGMTNTMATAVATRPVAEAVIRQQGLRLKSKGFLENLSVQAIPETQFVEARYEDSNPERAKRVANAIGTTFSGRVSELDQPGGAAITATVWEPAVIPADPVGPTPLRDGIFGLVLGGMVGFGLVFLLEHLDDSLRSPEEVEQISGVPLIGVIPVSETAKGKR
jgi:capsular polysaccharide biosynthesis protein